MIKENVLYMHRILFGHIKNYRLWLYKWAEDMLYYYIRKVRNRQIWDVLSHVDTNKTSVWIYNSDHERLETEECGKAEPASIPALETGTRACHWMIASWAWPEFSVQWQAVCTGLQCGQAKYPHAGLERALPGTTDPVDLSHRGTS